MIEKYGIYIQESGAGRRLVNCEESDIDSQIMPGEAFIVVPMTHMNPNFEVIDNLLIGDPVLTNYEPPIE